MNIIVFRPYKNLSDTELLGKIYAKMHQISKLQEQQEYLKEIMILNDMIIEAKKRNLMLNGEMLYKKILM